MIEKVGAILTSATLLSGCTQNIIHTTEPTLAAYPEINADILPDTLPDAVAQQTPNVVSVINTIPLLSRLEICSGVRIDQYDYLSAGHCDYQLASDALPLCENLTISSPSDLSDEGVSLPVNKKAGYYDGDTSGKTTKSLGSLTKDILLIETPTEPRPYTTKTHYGDPSSIQPGTPLYLVNFEPTANNTLRSPYGEDLITGEQKTGLNKPAILGAIALAHISNGTNSFTIAIAGVKSYSSPPETDVRAGSSGGPIYDEAGNLVGTTIDLFSYTTLKDVEYDFGLSISGIPEPSNVNVFLMQDITASLITSLQSKQQSTQGC